MPNWIKCHNLAGYPLYYNADLFLSVEVDIAGRSIIQLAIPNPDPEGLSSFMQVYVNESPEQVIALCGEPGRQRRLPRSAQQIRRRRAAA
jgi:hypothetical protein